MKRLFAVIACALTLAACQSKPAEDLPAASTDSEAPASVTTRESEPGSDKSGESGGGVVCGGATNFVKKQGSGEYALIFDDPEYNGGEFDIDFEVDWQCSENKKSFDALAMFFVDGYIQEFSLDGDEKALIHKVTVANGGTSYFNYKCALTTYDDSSDKHRICAVAMPFIRRGTGNFIADTYVMSMEREIRLNKVNKPEKDSVIMMSTAEKIGAHSDNQTMLPFERGDTDTELTFQCRRSVEMCCYVFCGEELLSQDGKYIFESGNTDPDKVSVQTVSVNREDLGKPLYVLYIAKSSVLSVPKGRTTMSGRRSMSDRRKT